MLLAFVMIPLLQKELDTFKDTIWNTHRIRQQKDTALPHGIPDHIYNFLVNMALRKVVGLRWYSYFNLEAIYQTQERKSVLSGCFFVSACIFERKSLIEVIGHPNSLAHLTSHFFFFSLACLARTLPYSLKVNYS